MKLILEYCSTDNCTFSCTSAIPFEYSSKDDFVLMVLDKIDEYKKECVLNYGNTDGSIWYRNGIVKIFNDEYNVGCLEDCIEYSVFELDEWFEKRKNK